jgi:hypothetical protein
MTAMNNNISMNSVSLCEANDRAKCLKKALTVFHTPEITRDEEIAKLYKNKATRLDIFACLGIHTETIVDRKKIDGKTVRTYSYRYNVIPYA